MMIGRSMFVAYVQLVLYSFVNPTAALPFMFDVLVQFFGVLLKKAGSRQYIRPR